MIEVVRGDVAAATTMAVLRPVSAEWDSVSAPARRIEVAAGPELVAHCQRLGELPVGSATLTPGGALSAQFVVHAVVRSAIEPVTESGVYRAVQNSLRRCGEWGITDLAMPPVGTGAGNLDTEEAAAIIIPVLLEHMRTAEHPGKVRIVVESDYEESAFQSEIQKYELPLLPAFPERPDWNPDG